MADIQVQQVLAKASSGQPEAQFLMSQICLQNKDLPGMLHWLKQASEKRFPAALDALGHCYEKGRGVSRDYGLALRHYDQAIDGDFALAAYHKAELLYKSRGGPDQQTTIRELLNNAASAGVPPALRALGYFSMQEPGGRRLAIDCFRRAAQGGDVVSSFNLAWCLLQGWDGEGESSTAEAAQCLRKAADAQYPLADAFLKEIAGAHAAAELRPSSGPLAFDEAVVLYPSVEPADGETISGDPRITLFSDVLDPVDRAHLMFLSIPYLTRAHVINPEGGRDGMVSDIRTSMSTYLPFSIVDMIGRYIELKIVGETGERLETSEPMSILRYAPGEYYRPHVDYFNPKLPTSRDLLENGGQRTASAVTYLAAPTSGGGTSFPKLKLHIPAVAGSTLWFRNCHEDGRIDDRSLHAGDTVEEGEKWVVTKWFRQRPTSYLEY